ncbi:MAG: hypothetical protein HC941_23980, partial [Microcoleus sp. SU_5_3]|nr:hypothetical protein [Microcoleus sp. SU_5_3]
MRLAERHIIKSTEPRFAQIDALAFQSKNLYNAANYVIRQNFVYGWGYLNYHKMAQFMKSHPAYIDLGLNNLVALTSNQPGFVPLLINGRPLKSINQFYNKRKA